MVLALARPEVFEVFPRLWAERQNVQEIRLKELGRKAGERLVRQALGDTVGTETIEHLVRQADGNALYLEELIRAAAEGKDDTLPDTVLVMIEARLGRLSLEARRVSPPTSQGTTSTGITGDQGPTISKEGHIGVSQG